MTKSELFLCAFHVTGLNLERFMDTLQAAGIPLLRAKRVSVKTMACRCYERDLPRIREIATERGWAVGGVRALRLSRVRARLLARPGLLIGLGAMLLLLAVANQFILRVTVQGAGAYLPEIRAFLSERGVYPGARARGLALAELEQRLYFRYPTFSWFTVARRGMTVSVSCREGTEAKSESGAQALVALCDGIVTRVETHAGTARVKAGQLVRKGDVLIEGWERTQDEQRREVGARGIVTARCFISVRVRLPAKELTGTPTGGISEACQLVTPVFCFPETLETPNYLCYDTEIVTLPVGGAFFPVTLRRARYMELIPRETARREEEVRREAETAALRKLAGCVKSDEIVDKWVDYCMIEDGELLAIATAELQRNIAVPGALGD